MFIFLSVFAGLEKLNLKFYNNVNPEIKVIPSRGKSLKNIDELVKTLEFDKSIASYSKTIEEKAYVSFQGKQDIVYIKGIEDRFTDIVRLDTTIIFGEYLNIKANEIIVSYTISSNLSIFVDDQDLVKIYTPKPGKGLANSTDDFRNIEAKPVGVFVLNNEYEKHIFAPLHLTRTLLGLNENDAYAIELQLNEGINIENYKIDLSEKIGLDYEVKTRKEQSASILKMMNLENLVIYLILTLIVIIFSFNLAGAIIIIILDKRHHTKTMWSFGVPVNIIKRIFFYTGSIMTLFAWAIGISLASMVVYAQKYTGFFEVNTNLPFPVEFTLKNYIIVSVTVISIGVATSFLVSRKIVK